MYLDDSAALLRTAGFEGSVPYLYVDTVGVVTVGVGHALFRLDDALALPFAVMGRKATMSEIAADYARVRALGRGKAAAAYRCSTSPVLDAGTIDGLLRVKLEGFDKALRARLPGYGVAPDVAKLALLDMAYNLGVDGLLKYQHLCAALVQRDYRLCAASCHRLGPGEARNVWTATQFLKAAALPVVVVH